MRQDVKRQAVNARVRVAIQTTVKEIGLKPSAANLQNAYAALDTAVKKRVIHANKAARIKSHLAKLLQEKTVSIQKSAKKTIKKPTKSS